MAQRELSIKTSTNIRQALYDPDTQTLTVHFLNGGSYTYSGVDEVKANGFETAESAGRYLHANIKGLHTHTKIG